MVDQDKEFTGKPSGQTLEEKRSRDQRRLESAMEEVVESISRGERYNRKALLEKYNDVANELEECLGSLEFVQSVAPKLSPTTASDVAERKSPFSISERLDIGDFRIIREIGRGGMGVVYEAEQMSMARRVALKVLPFAALLDQRQLQRFRTEARAAGSLHHPHIVPVFNVGTERGIHYYAMQLIEGPSLAEVLQGLARSDTETIGLSDRPQHQGDEEASHSLSPCLASETRRNIQAAISTKHSASKLDYHRTVARWGQQAAEALAYAHENGVLHRDIKPANLLIDDAFNVLVTDFGLARLESDASVTMTGDVLGTLRYMSPEQALGKRVLVDQRADVYSLGVTLYELTTMRAAFGGSDRQEVLQKISTEEPVAPRKIDVTIPVDLETIILKASSKSPEDRYSSASELADDLGRFLSNKMIAARPPTLADRTSKWLRRHSLVAWSIVTTLVILSVASLIGLTWSRQKNAQLANAVNRAERKTEEASAALGRESAALKAATIAHAQSQRALSDAKRAGQQSRKSLYLATMRQAHDDLRRHDGAGFAESMLRFVPKKGEHDHRDWEWHYLLSLYHQEEKVLREHVNGVVAVAWHPQESLLATASADGSVRLWDPATWSLVTTIGHLGSVQAIAWHPDGELLAVATRGKIHLWNTTNGSKTGECVLGGASRSVAFSPNGQYLATAVRDVSWDVWDVETLKPIWSLDVQGAMCVAWSPDGGKLACGTNASVSEVRVLDAANSDTISKVGGFANGVFDLAWSPSGNEVAVCEAHQAIKVLTADDLELLHSTNVSRTMEAVCWSPDGLSIAAGIGRNVQIYDSKLQLRETLSGHSRDILSLDWKSDKRTVVAGAAGGTTRVWDTDQTANLLGTREVCLDVGGDGQATTFFSSTGRFVAVVLPSSKEIVVRDLRTGAVWQRFPLDSSDRAAAVTWNGDDTWFAYSHDGQSITLCDVANGRSRVLTNIQAGRIRQLDWNPVGERLAAVVIKDEESKRNSSGENFATTIRICNAETGEQERSMTFRAPTVRMAWDPSGGKIATVEYSGWSVVGRIWDASTGEVQRTLSGHHRNVGVPKWSPDGTRIAAFGWMGHISIWDAQSGILRHRLYGHESKTTGAWHPDGKRFLSLGEGGEMRLWDVESGERILGVEAKYHNAMFSPDGLSLYLCGTSLDVIDLHDSMSLGSRQLVEHAGSAMIHRRSFSEAEDLIESLEPPSPERLYLLRLLFDRNRAWMSGRDVAADGLLPVRLAKLMTLWETLVTRLDEEDSDRVGISETEDLSNTLLYCANMTPNWLDHYGQDVLPAISIIEQITDKVEAHFAASSPSPDATARVLRFLAHTRNRVEKLKRDRQPDSRGHE